MSLSGRVAFVTGASQGIGRACALKLATTGAAVAVAARNQDKLNELASEITAAGGKAAVFALDVTDEEQIKSAIKAAIAQFGKVDILVNNAGITRDQLVMRLKRADWDAVLQTNLTSAYLCIQQVTSSMLKQRWDESSTSPAFSDRWTGGAGELLRVESWADRPHHGRGARTGIA